MLKRKLLTITLAILLLTTTIEARYNGYAAAWYARYYAKSTNYEYSDYHGINMGGDCTNFISQALKYGGLQVNYRGASRYGKYYVWYPDSPTWISSPTLRKRFIYGYENARKIGCRTNLAMGECKNPKSLSQIKPRIGDVIFQKSVFGYDDVVWHHTMMVTKVVNYSPWRVPVIFSVYYSAHDDDALNVNIREKEEKLNDEAYTRFKHRCSQWILEYWRPY